MNADQTKPVLRLLPIPATAENLAEVWRQLTGKEPTAGGMERFRKAAARVNARAGAAPGKAPEKEGKGEG
jgi:hypothetical protein